MMEQGLQNGQEQTMTRQETIDRAVDWALAMARDDRHGYDQEKRWGPDYDCSSFVIACLSALTCPRLSKATGICRVSENDTYGVTTIDE